LRKSDDPSLRDNVYINPNLTEAEAKAQFEIRQQRRRQKVPIQKGVAHPSEEHRRKISTSLNADAALFIPIAPVISGERQVGSPASVAAADSQ
jgi:hypothetical protein